MRARNGLIIHIRFSLISAATQVRSKFASAFSETPMLDLQKTRREAALTFTGRALEVEEVSAALFRVLERRPVEVLVPASRGL